MHDYSRIRQRDPAVKGLLAGQARHYFAYSLIGMGLGAEGFNLTVDSECVRRLGLDFTRFARICLQTDTWLAELRQAQKQPVRA